MLALSKPLGMLWFLREVGSNFQEVALPNLLQVHSLIGRRSTQWYWFSSCWRLPSINMQIHVAWHLSYRTDFLFVKVGFWTIIKGDLTAWSHNVQILVNGFFPCKGKTKIYDGDKIFWVERIYLAYASSNCYWRAIRNTSYGFSSTDYKCTVMVKKCQSGREFTSTYIKQGQ